VTITGAQIVAEVHKFIGDPYVFGAAGPKEFDCSGLVYYAFRKLGDMSVPRTSEQQWKWVQHISYSELKPGDLIFMNFGNEASPGHVVIYAGDNKIIQAPQPGQDVQEISWKPSDMAAWGGKIVGYGRPPGADISGVGADSGSPALGLAGGISAALSEIPGFGFLGPVVSKTTGVGQTVGDIATATGAVANDMSALLRFMAALFRPSLWLRVGAFFVGLLAAGLGLWSLAKALDIQMPNPPMVVPV
jgi:hypothetical protein